MQNPRTGSGPGPRPSRRGTRLGVAAAAVTGWVVSSVLLAGPALAASNDSTNVAGSQHADKWPVLKTLGIFAGIPLAAAVLIVFFVLLGPILRSGRAGSTEDAVFAGPHAGPVETGREPRTHTSEPDGPAERPAGVAGSADPEPSVAGPAPAQGGAGASW